MAGSKQMDRLNKLIKSAERGLESGIKSLQQNIKALTAGGIIVPPKPKKDVIKALQRLRRALNNALMALEKKIGGKPARRKASKRKSASAA